MLNLWNISIFETSKKFIETDFNHYKTIKWSMNFTKSVIRVDRISFCFDKGNERILFLFLYTKWEFLFTDRSSQPVDV